VILHPTFEGKKTAIMPLVKCTPMTWKFHCRDLTNRVCFDAVCTPADFHLPRLRYTAPRPYPPEEFARTYAWMVSWGLIPADATYERLVDNRIEIIPR
jgi:hypothetical protein